MNVQAPEPLRLVSLRRDVDPPPQVLQTDGRRGHAAPASRVVGGSAVQQGPFAPRALPRFVGPVRHPLAVGRFPGTPGYTPDLTPLISQRDEEGFSSCSMRLCHRAVAPSPAGARRRVSQTATARVAFTGESTARPPGLGSFAAPA